MYHTIVLLDVSGSMIGLYDGGDIRQNLRKIMNMKDIPVLRFSEGLSLMPKQDENNLFDQGVCRDTNLKEALDDLELVFGLPNRLLIVTDGYHATVTSHKRIPEVKSCLPENIGDHMSWLQQKEKAMYANMVTKVTLTVELTRVDLTQNPISTEIQVDLLAQQAGDNGMLSVDEAMRFSGEGWPSSALTTILRKLQPDLSGKVADERKNQASKDSSFSLPQPPSGEVTEPPPEMTRIPYPGGPI